MEQYTEILKVILLTLMVLVGIFVSVALLILLIKEIKNK